MIEVYVSMSLLGLFAIISVVHIRRIIRRGRARDSAALNRKQPEEYENVESY